MLIDLVTKNKDTRGREIKASIKGTLPTDFFPFANKVMQTFEDNGQIGTYDRYKSVLKKLKDYVGDRALTFDDIDAAFLRQYEVYLRKKVGNNVNTTGANMKAIRRIINDAAREGIIKLDKNPFLEYKIKSEKVERAFLNAEELALIENYPITPDTKKEIYRDMYLFSARMAGIRISDLLMLRWRDFDGTHVYFKVRKNGEPHRVKVTESAKKILDKYRKGRPINSFVFPVLRISPNETIARVIDSAISGAESYANQVIRDIAKKVDITKKVSSHTSRHTFATMALQKSVLIEVVSKLLGHANLRETQVYAKVVNEAMDRAMDMME